MHLASLNFDVLVYLINFVDPDDRLNLVLSGILKGFENVSKGIDLQRRTKYCGVVLRPSRENVGQLEIRSYKILCGSDHFINEASDTFERLAKEGYLKNNRELSLPFILDSDISWFLENVCFMRNLETLESWGGEIKLEQLEPLFRSCPKLVELHLHLNVNEKLEMDENVKNVLKKGFERLLLFKFSYGHIDNDTWPVIQEILTWLKDCVRLGMRNIDEDIYYKNRIRVKHSSLTVNPTFTRNLQSLSIVDVPVEIIEWILPTCFNIHTLKLEYLYQKMDMCVKMIPFKKVKKLDVKCDDARDLREIFRNCHQMEKLKVFVFEAELKDFAELDAENLKEVYLRWDDDLSIEDVLPVLKKFRYLQRLTFEQLPVPSFEVLLDFIMGMEHLTYFYLGPYCDRSTCEQLESMRDKINQLVLPRRPNFKLDLTCH